MSILIELKSDQDILNLVEKYRSILIIGCMECANISVGYSKGHKTHSRGFDKDVTCWEPTAIDTELKRLKILLGVNDKNVSVKIEKPCMLTDEKEHFLALMRTDIHAILCICCVAGIVGIEKTVGKSIPLLAGAHTTGIIQYHIDISAEGLFINSEKSTVIKFDEQITSEAVDLNSYWKIISEED